MKHTAILVDDLPAVLSLLESDIQQKHPSKTLIVVRVIGI